MPATAHGSAEGASSTSPGLAGTAPNVPIAAEAALPSIGERWREKYDVTAEVPSSPDVRVWRARLAEDGREVVIRAFRPAEPEARAQAWNKLSGIDSPHLQHARDAARVGEWRVEVADLPEGIPLSEWRATRGTLDLSAIRTLVGHVAEALGALHAFELVHLALRPEAVFVVEAGGLTFQLAALDGVAGFDRKEPVPAAVDPLFAPPEAVGLTVHVPGPGLCAWDWWSLGRLVQQAILGRPIVTEIANKADAAGLKEAAELLLLEADPKAPRAGGVEKMSGLEPGVQLLLRGLLTSAKEARWTGDNVDRWIRGLPVKEHYDTARKETHMRWRGRPYTVPELAATLQSADHWAENAVQLFEQTTPGTLAHFLRWSPNQNLAQEQLGTALELGEVLPLKLATPSARREAITMVALLQLSAGRLIWRGQPFEAPIIAAMMTELGEAETMMILRGLSTRSTALQIERIDAAAGRLLTELGRTVGDVEGLLKRYGWLDAADVSGAARLFLLALQPIPALRATRESLAQRFAGSDHAAMDKLFKAQNVGRGELVALAWADANPEKLKFYTHAEAARRRAEALRKRGGEITHALTWAQFERALQVGLPALAGWGSFLLIWFFVGLLALVLVPGPRGAALIVAPGLIALVFRMLAAPRERRALRSFVPEANWSWRDGPTRCRQELRIAGSGVRRELLETELANIEKELAALKVDPAPAPLPALPRFAGVRFAGMLSWGLVVASLGLAGWRVYVHPISAAELKAAWGPAKPKAEKPAVAVAKTEAEADVKVSWPFKPGDSAMKASVQSVAPATSEQKEYATKHGREIVAPYRAETIGTPILMAVPAKDGAIAVMIFDGKRGDLAGDQVYTLDFAPIPRTWVDVNGRKAIFIDR